MHLFLEITMMDTSLERTAQQIRKEQVELREIISELKAVSHRMEQLQDAEIKQSQAKLKAEESNKDKEDDFIDLLKVTNGERILCNLQVIHQMEGVLSRKEALLV